MTVDDLAEAASDALEPSYRLLDSLTQELLRRHSARTALTEAHFSGLQTRLAALLREEPGIWGMGFAAAPFVVDGHERYMAWWQRHNERVARLRLNFDATSIDVYDYLQMDWYQLPLHGQYRTAYGPYVDYSGSDLYTITCTVPVIADRAFLGVAGVDLVVGDLERRLQAVLRQTDHDALVFNTERRVIAANTPRWFVGTRLPALPAMGPPTGATSFREVAELPLGTGWGVAIAWPQRS